VPAAGFHSPHVKAARLLHTKKHRAQARCFLIEGPTLLTAALDAGAVPASVFVGRDADQTERAAATRAQAAGAAAFDVDARTLASLSQTRAPQGVVAQLSYVDEPLEKVAAGLPASGPLTLLILDDLDDPGNAGTLVRSAEAFGAGAVCFGPESVDPYNDKLVRATMGSLFRVPIVRYRDWGHIQSVLRAARVQTVGSAAAASDICSVDLEDRVALVLGNERRGLQALQNIERTVGIPQKPAGDSLNVAVAGSILLYELARRRVRTTRG